MRPLHLAIDHQWYDGNKRKRSVVNTRSSLNKNRWLTHIEWTTKNRDSNRKETEHEVRAEKKTAGQRKRVSASACICDFMNNTRLVEAISVCVEFA